MKPNPNPQKSTKNLLHFGVENVGLLFSFDGCLVLEV